MQKDKITFKVGDIVKLNLSNFYKRWNAGREYGEVLKVNYDYLSVKWIKEKCSSPIFKVHSKEEWNCTEFALVKRYDSDKICKKIKQI